MEIVLFAGETSKRSNYKTVSPSEKSNPSQNALILGRPQTEKVIRLGTTHSSGAGKKEKGKTVSSKCPSNSSHSGSRGNAIADKKKSKACIGNSLLSLITSNSSHSGSRGNAIADKKKSKASIGNSLLSLITVSNSSNSGSRGNAIADKKKSKASIKNSSLSLITVSPNTSRNASTGKHKLDTKTLPGPKISMDRGKSICLSNGSQSQSRTGKQLSLPPCPSTAPRGRGNKILVRNGSISPHDTAKRAKHFTDSANTSRNASTRKRKLDTKTLPVPNISMDRGKSVCLFNDSRSRTGRQVSLTPRLSTAPRGSGNKILVRNGSISPQDIAKRAKHSTDSSNTSGNASTSKRKLDRETLPGPNISIDRGKSICLSNDSQSRSRTGKQVSLPPHLSTVPRGRGHTISVRSGCNSPQNIATRIKQLAEQSSLQSNYVKKSHAGHSVSSSTMAATGVDDIVTGCSGTVIGKGVLIHPSSHGINAGTIHTDNRQLEADEILARELQEQLYHDDFFEGREIDEHLPGELQHPENLLHTSIGSQNMSHPATRAKQPSEQSIPQTNYVEQSHAGHSALSNTMSPIGAVDIVVEERDGGRVKENRVLVHPSSHGINTGTIDTDNRQLEADEILARELQEQLYHDDFFEGREINEHLPGELQHPENLLHTSIGSQNMSHPATRAKQPSEQSSLQTNYVEQSHAGHSAVSNTMSPIGAVDIVAEERNSGRVKENGVLVHPSSHGINTGTIHTDNRQLEADEILARELQEQLYHDDFFEGREINEHLPGELQHPENLLHTSIGSQNMSHPATRAKQPSEQSSLQTNYVEQSHAGHSALSNTMSPIGAVDIVAEERDSGRVKENGVLVHPSSHGINTGTVHTDNRQLEADEILARELQEQLYHDDFFEGREINEHLPGELQHPENLLHTSIGSQNMSHPATRAKQPSEQSSLQTNYVEQSHAGHSALSNTMSPIGAVDIVAEERDSGRVKENGVLVHPSSHGINTGTVHTDNRQLEADEILARELQEQLYHDDFFEGREINEHLPGELQHPENLLHTSIGSQNMSHPATRAKQPSEQSSLQTNYVEQSHAGHSALSNTMSPIGAVDIVAEERDSGRVKENGVLVHPSSHGINTGTVHTDNRQLEADEILARELQEQLYHDDFFEGREINEHLPGELQHPENLLHTSIGSQNMSHPATRAKQPSEQSSLQTNYVEQSHAGHSALSNTMSPIGAVDIVAEERDSGRVKENGVLVHPSSHGINTGTVHTDNRQLEADEILARELQEQLYHDDFFEGREIDEHLPGELQHPENLLHTSIGSQNMSHPAARAKQPSEQSILQTNYVEQSHAGHSALSNTMSPIGAVDIVAEERDSGRVKENGVLVHPSSHGINTGTIDTDNRQLEADEILARELQEQLYHDDFFEGREIDEHLPGELQHPENLLHTSIGSQNMSHPATRAKQPSEQTNYVEQSHAGHSALSNTMSPISANGIVAEERDSGRVKGKGVLIHPSSHGINTGTIHTDSRLSSGSSQILVLDPELVELLSMPRFTNRLSEYLDVNDKNGLDARARQLEADEILARELQEQQYHDEIFEGRVIDEHLEGELQHTEDLLHASIGGHNISHLATRTNQSSEQSSLQTSYVEQSHGGRSASSNTMSPISVDDIVAEERDGGRVEGNGVLIHPSLHEIIAGTIHTDNRFSSGESSSSSRSRVLGPEVVEFLSTPRFTNRLSEDLDDNDNNGLVARARQLESDAILAREFQEQQYHDEFFEGRGIDDHLAGELQHSEDIVNTSIDGHNISHPTRFPRANRQPRSRSHQNLSNRRTVPQVHLSNRLPQLRSHMTSRSSTPATSSQGRRPRFPLDIDLDMDMEEDMEIDHIVDVPDTLDRSNAWNNYRKCVGNPEKREKASQNGPIFRKSQTEKVIGLGTTNSSGVKKMEKGETISSKFPSKQSHHGRISVIDLTEENGQFQQPKSDFSECGSRDNAIEDKKELKASIGKCKLDTSNATRSSHENCEGQTISSKFPSKQAHHGHISVIDLTEENGQFQQPKSDSSHCESRDNAIEDKKELKASIGKCKLGNATASSHENCEGQTISSNFPSKQSHHGCISVIDLTEEDGQFQQPKSDFSHCGSRDNAIEDKKELEASIGNSSLPLITDSCNTSKSAFTGKWELVTSNATRSSLENCEGQGGWITTHNSENPNEASHNSEILFLTSSGEPSSSELVLFTNRSSGEPSSSELVLFTNRLSEDIDDNGNNSLDAWARQLEADEILALELQEQVYHEEFFEGRGLDEHLAWELQHTEDLLHTSSDSHNISHPRLDILEASEDAVGDFNDMGMADDIFNAHRDLNEDDYETLLALDEENHQHTGASADQINSLPQSTIQTNNFTEACAICLETPVQGEIIRHLPCLHKFHKDCIDPWLRRKTSCPVCKSSIT